MGDLATLLGHLEPDPVRRGRQWERLCAWFLAHDPAYRALLREVWLWRDWPGRWGVDAGIDLVAEDVEGHLWAVQAKAYDPAYTVTKRDLDTFLSESSRPQFAFRLLVATTDLLSENARRTVEGQEKPVGLLLRGDLERAQVEWPDDPSSLAAPALSPKAPRPHQQEALAAVLAGFEAHDRGQLIMACGTGKTLVGLWAAEALGATRTLVLLPSLSLLAQVLGEWTANASEPFPFLPVCSDPTVRGEDEWVSTIADLGFPVTTDPAQVAAFLRRRGRRVVFSTYQSSPRIAEAQALGRVPGFDLVIADEAHRTAGPASTDFATVLDPNLIRARGRLFMTATPRFFTGRVLRAAEEADLEVASMDDEEHYGQVFHRLTFGEAISRDLLSDYRVVIVGVDDPMVATMAQEGRLVRLEGLDAHTDARTLAAHIALAKAMRRFNLRRTITFHGRVKGARDFATRLPQVVAWMPADQTPDGTIWAEHVSGDMPTGLRTTRLDRLRNLGADERGLLSNARCLAEGVDVPTLDGVAFIDPKGSQTDIVQAVGRAIRKAPDKTLGTIVLPVFIEGADDPEKALEASAFKPVWAVLRALRDQDEQLAEALDGIRQRQGRESIGLPAVEIPKVDIDLPVGVDFIHALQAKVVERTTSPWEFMFGLLERFAGREGHTRVPALHTESSFNLGFWITIQRMRKRQGALGARRMGLLEALPGWQWDPHDEQWDEGYERLVALVGRRGHAAVPAKYQEEGFRLGGWVSKQRDLYLKGQMADDRAQRLEALPGWIWRPHQTRWDKGYGFLLKFVEREGHAEVPDQHWEGEYLLGQWVRVQRRAHGANRLDAQRAGLLEALAGWTWVALDERWERAFRALEAYASREGHAVVPDHHVEADFRLGQWVSGQRVLHARGRLSQQRAARLQAVPGWVWNARTDKWERTFALLAEFTAQQGHARVPTTYTTEDEPLGSWVATQRRFRRLGQLAPDRAARLEALPGWEWSPRTGPRTHHRGATG
jgi:superfamily II DNA or RNA helicase